MVLLCLTRWICGQFMYGLSRLHDTACWEGIWDSFVRMRSNMFPSLYNGYVLYTIKQCSPCTAVENTPNIMYMMRYTSIL